MRKIAIAFVLISALCVSAFAAQETGVPTIRVSGIVLDSSNSPVSGAEVLLRAGEGVTRRMITGADGRFAFDKLTAKKGTVKIEAQGFAQQESVWSIVADSANEIVIVLAPALLTESVTVTATRTTTKLDETAASVRVLLPENLDATAALTLDDALKQVPGFQLFRRTSSRAANPTTQGVSLRGVGASGASRALVLDDGIPLNDPFGGWVYWGRVPRASVGRVEILRGGASDLYGSAALGGVVQILTKRIEEHSTLALEASYGSQRTLDASLFASARWKGVWGASLAAETFHTGGYYLLNRAERGEVDTPSASRSTALNASLEREINSALRVFARVSSFGEARDNGTRLQRNRTHIRQAATGGDWRQSRAGAFTFRAYASSQVFDQSFSAISEDRQSETFTRNQRVPAQAVGFLSHWSRDLKRGRCAARVMNSSSSTTVLPVRSARAGESGRREFSSRTFFN